MRLESFNGCNMGAERPHKRIAQHSRAPVGVLGVLSCVCLLVGYNKHNAHMKVKCYLMVLSARGAFAAALTTGVVSQTGSTAQLLHLSTECPVAIVSSLIVLPDILPYTAVIDFCC